MDRRFGSGWSATRSAGLPESSGDELVAVLAGGAAALVGLPVVVIVLVLTMAVLSASTCAAGGGLAADAPIPGEARAWAGLAQQSCPDLPQAWIAAVMAQESSFRPDAYADDVNGGTWGLLQLSQPVWQAAYGGAWAAGPERQRDLGHQGAGDTRPHRWRVPVRALQTVRGMRADHPRFTATRDLTELHALVVAHNAGEGTLACYP